MLITLPHRDIAQTQVEHIPPHRVERPPQVEVIPPHRVFTLVLLNMVKGRGQTARLAIAFPMLNKCNMYCEIQQHQRVHRFTFIWMVQPKKSV
jgi:hypothetical protein